MGAAPTYFLLDREANMLLFLGHVKMLVGGAPGAREQSCAGLGTGSHRLSRQMVQRVGFEPTTSCSRSMRATKLHYRWLKWSEMRDLNPHRVLPKQSCYQVTLISEILIVGALLLSPRFLRKQPL